MNNQQFLQVVKNGEVLFEFPAANEDNVRAMLIKQKLDAVCEIKHKVEDVQVLKKAVASQERVIDLTEPKPKQTKAKPTPGKGTSNDNSRISTSTL